jgi:hypothetical protein
MERVSVEPGQIVKMWHTQNLTYPGKSYWAFGEDGWNGWDVFITLPLFVTLPSLA